MVSLSRGREGENRATINLVTSRPGKVSNVPHHLHPTTLPEMPYSAFEGRARSSTQSNRTNATMRARSVDARLAPPRLCQWREDKRAELRQRESEALCIHIGRFAVNELKLALGRQGVHPFVCSQGGLVLLPYPEVRPAVLGPRAHQSGQASS